MQRQVYIADWAGYCYGVKRVMNLVDKHENSYTLGPVIHNPVVIKELEQEGHKVVEKVQDASGTVIVRAHGIPKEVMTDAKERNVKIVDGTCPFVTSEQNHAKRLEDEGYKVVVIGKKEHPEIIGVMSYVKDAIVIKTVEEAEKIRYFDKIGVVVQTTMKQGLFNDITNVLKKHCGEIKVKNTICDDTEKRQDSALRLAEYVDIMIVIGGFNSSNTRNLGDLCSGKVESHQIETVNDLKDEWFDNKVKIGICAGASTPDSIIEKVKKHIEGLN